MIGIVGIVLAVISILLAVIFYRRSRKFKQLGYAVRTWKIIEDYSATLPGLSVTYGDQRVQYLSVSKLAFWNRGSETINWSDVATADPLRIHDRTRQYSKRYRHEENFPPK